MVFSALNSHPLIGIICTNYLFENKFLYPRKMSTKLVDFINHGFLSTLSHCYCHRSIPKNIFL